MVFGTFSFHLVTADALFNYYSINIRTNQLKETTRHILVDEFLVFVAMTLNEAFFRIGDNLK